MASAFFEIAMLPNAVLIIFVMLMKMIRFMTLDQIDKIRTAR